VGGEGRRGESEHSMEFICLINVASVFSDLKAVFSFSEH
jgi:hypothetical protein